MQIEIIKANPDHLQPLMSMIGRVVRIMNDGGNEQWGADYPAEDIIAEDINSQTMYIAAGENGQVLGMMVLDENQDDQYAGIDWQQKQGPNLIMHRLAVDPNAQGQGIASKLIAFAERYALENGYRSLRLDTYEKNRTAQGLYLKLGYEIRGKINYPGREADFPVFEKVLRQA
ncbi:GCN5 family acetyltransferase [Paenibacillus yonginensis]|uniref:GCN5 family acetyltransferase n=1 Tax=Paenibacillus yonginensis TaxID=1462996 RepID=A0A1B1MYV5_9BACL|nr:GNAT family N-acetyltransferase [Paenibacillus yonginensis]ANS74351.1 GCN5 family acetyltransferase [Paenibacillus yonginensis]